MADNYVQIRIKASDTAKPDLDSLRADLDELGTKVDTAKVDVNDDEAKLKLLEINAQLATLNKRVANPRIDAAGAARAEASIEKLRAETDKLRESSDKAREHATEDLDKIKEHASRLHETISGLAGKSGLLGKLLFGAAGDAEGAGGGGGGLSGILGGGEGGGGGMLAGIAIAVPAIEAALVEVTGLVSGFAAAGTGAGAFALLAVPAFDKVKTAYTNITAAQAAYHKAQLTEQMDPTKANASAVAKALLNLKESYKGLDPAERGAVHGIQNLMDTYHKMAKEFEPDAFKIFNQGLKIANNLLPLVKPFADTFANSLDGLLKRADKFTQSKGFEEWVKQFHKLEGPAVTAIGTGIGKVAISIGKLLTTMSAKDDVHAINIAFDGLAGTIKGITWVVSHLMHSWDELTSGFRHSSKDAKNWQHDISEVFDRARHDIADFAHNVSSHFDEIRHEIANLAHNFASYFDEIRANIHRWAADVGRDVTRVVDWFRALPGRIMATLASLPGRLFSAGAHIISMLAAGIRSAIGDVVGAIGSVVGEITSHLPFSPAKKGPLSGRGDPTAAGKRISQMLAQGLDEGRGAVSGAADRMAGAASLGGHGGAGGHGQIVLEFHVPTALAAQLSPQFWTAFANGVRARGGSPGIVTRKVSFG